MVHFVLREHVLFARGKCVPPRVVPLGGGVVLRERALLGFFWIVHCVILTQNVTKVNCMLGCQESNLDLRLRRPSYYPLYYTRKSISVCKFLQCALDLDLS